MRSRNIEICCEPQSPSEPGPETVPEPAPPPEPEPTPSVSDTKAKCNTLICPSDYELKESSENISCNGQVCDETVDLDTCCVDKTGFCTGNKDPSLDVKCEWLDGENKEGENKGTTVNECCKEPGWLLSYIFYASIWAFIGSVIYRIFKSSIQASWWAVWPTLLVIYLPLYILSIIFITYKHFIPPDICKGNEESDTTNIFGLKIGGCLTTDKYNDLYWINQRESGIKIRGGIAAIIPLAFLGKYIYDESITLS